MATTNVNAIVLENNNCIAVKGGARNMRVELSDTGLALFKAAKSGTKKVVKADFIQHGGDEVQWDALQSALEALYCKICVYVRTATEQQAKNESAEAVVAGGVAEGALRNLTALLGTRKSDRGTYKNAVFVNTHMLAVFTGLVQRRRGVYYDVKTFKDKFVPLLFWVMAGNSWATAEEIMAQSAKDGKSTTSPRKGKVAQLTEQLEAMKNKNTQLQEELDQAEKLGAEVQEEHDMIATLRLYMAENAGNIEESAIRGILKMTKKAK